MSMTAVSDWEITPYMDMVYSTDVEGRWLFLQNECGERDLTEDETRELNCLSNLLEQGREFPDWEYGVTLIRDSYFVEYAQEFADDIGVVPTEYTWPISCIDWNQAARELQIDYTPIEFAGITYWVR